MEKNDETLILDKLEVEKLKELYFWLQGYLERNNNTFLCEVHKQIIEKVLYAHNAL